jgi:hypothetical protein
MVLAHWSGVLGRPEPDRTVPDVARAVFDKNWPGQAIGRLIPPLLAAFPE